MADEILNRLRLAAGDPRFAVSADLAREAADEIERLRGVVKAAYVEGALDFGGFNEVTGEKAQARFPVTDSARWVESPEAWREDCEDA